MELLHRTFAIGRCLGRGGFGEVYRADMTSSTGLTSSVALKVLRRDLAPGGQAVQRLRDEGAMLARLNHPTILRVHDLVVLDGRVSLVTEYVDGEDLERCLRGPDRIGIRALAEVIGQVASALDAAFNAPLALDGAPLRLVHRDVKPSNVRISRHGEVKLLDFGIARSDEITREARTMTDMMVGSPPYMAPERFLDNEIRPASDVFALGAMVLEGLIGRRVFEVPVTMLASYAIDRHRYEAYVASRFDLVPPGNVGAMIELARPLLAYDPDDRPTAAEVARGCEDLADSLEGSPLARWCRERRWVDPPEEVGDLDGKLLSEGTLARPYPSETTTPLPQPKAAPSAAEEITAPAEVVSRARPASLAVWLGGASVVSTLLGVGGLVIVAATLAVAVGWPSLRTPWPTRSPVVAPILAPVDPPETPADRAPAPPSPPAPGADPVAGPEPDRGPPSIVEDPASIRPPPAAGPPPQPPSPRTDPSPGPPIELAPEPDPIPPSPTPVTSVPSGPSSGGVRVTATGEATSVHLQGPGGRFALPATVPPGTYAIVIDWISGRHTEGVLKVVAGHPLALKCVDRGFGWGCVPDP